MCSLKEGWGVVQNRWRWEELAVQPWSASCSRQPGGSAWPQPALQEDLAQAVCELGKKRSQGVGSPTGLVSVPRCPSPAVRLDITALNLSSHLSNKTHIKNKTSLHRVV